MEKKRKSGRKTIFHISIYKHGHSAKHVSVFMCSDAADRCVSMDAVGGQRGGGVKVMLRLL